MKRYPRRGLLPIAVLLVLLFAPNSSLADFRITHNAGDSAQPSVALGTDRLARIVWSDNRTGGYEIYWATFDPAGNRIGDIVRVTTSGASSNVPRIAVDSQNRSFIAWREGSGSGSQIYFARVGPGGVIDVSPRQISPGGTCVCPDIATTPDGTSHVVYERSTILHYMQYLVVDESGTVVSTKNPGDFDILGVAKYPSVTLDPDGTAWMLWKDANNWVEGLYVAAYTASGTEQTRGRIYVGDGITWSAPLVPRPNWVWFLFQDWPEDVEHVYSWMGSSVPPVLVSPNPGPSRRPRIAGADGYKVYCVWEEYGTGVSRIMAQGWQASDGTILPGPIEVSDGIGEATQPDIGSDGAGQYYVVWRDTRDGNSEIYMDGVKPVALRVTSMLRPEHDDDTPVSTPLPGVTVKLSTRGQEWVGVTNTSGVAQFATPHDPSAHYEASLSGPDYHVRVERVWPFSDLDPPHVVVSADAEKDTTDYQWSAGEALEEGPALHAIYYTEMFRKDYLSSRNGYEWTLPSQLDETNESNQLLLTIYQFDWGLSNAAGASTLFVPPQLRFLRHRCEEADVVYHEFGHLVVADRMIRYGKNRCTLGHNENGQGASMDEGFADYLAASYTNDPVIARCGDLTYPYSPTCKPLRTITDVSYSCVPSVDYRYGAHNGSHFLSGALWELREEIDGVDAPSAPLTDALVLAALDSMITSKSEVSPDFTFFDFYSAMIEANQEQGGPWGDLIDDAFGRRNISANPAPCTPLSWADDAGIAQVQEIGNTDVALTWYRIPGAQSYDVLLTTVDYSQASGASLGKYVTLVEGIADTAFVFSNRDSLVEYAFSVVAVDSGGQRGYEAAPVVVEAAGPTGVPNTSRTRATGGRIAFTSPNPFNPSTRIAVQLYERCDVGVTVFDVAGRRVRVLRRDILGPGMIDIYWDGRDDHGARVASGQYFVVLRGTDWKDTRKVLLLK